MAAAFPQLDILEWIGTGGMGAVYKVRQPKLDRWVALKLLSPSLATSPAFAERFHREARLLARLNHPGIVSVHDFGETGGFFFLLMEFVDGVNLRQAMEAVFGLLGVPTGLLIRLLPQLLAGAARSFGWKPAPGQGESFTGAVLIGCFVVVVVAAWTLRRWATGGRPDAATSRKSMRDATGWVHRSLAVVAYGCLAGRICSQAVPPRFPAFWS